MNKEWFYCFHKVYFLPESHCKYFNKLIQLHFHDRNLLCLYNTQQDMKLHIFLFLWMHILMSCKLQYRSFHQQTNHKSHSQFWKMLKDILIHNFLITDRHKYRWDKYCNKTYQRHQTYTDWECCLLLRD